ncbi:MAG: PilZ domain-containing protein [Lachnospiraceae bacterium]|nr:PilZ domain-containing protein [Lachnospiraceae bacterium]
MSEQRMYPRTDLNETVKLSLIGEGDGMFSEPFDVEILNMSTDGIGFKCKQQLLIGEVLTGKIAIWTKEKLDVFMKIIRCSEEGGGYYGYGCTFVGMEGTEQTRIEIYQLFHPDDVE